MGEGNSALSVTYAVVLPRARVARDTPASDKRAKVTMAKVTSTRSNGAKLYCIIYRTQGYRGMRPYTANTLYGFEHPALALGPSLPYRQMVGV